MARTSIGIRKHFVLSKVQGERLDKLAQKTGITVSEHLRRAVDLYFLKIVEDYAKVRK
jgi:predicted DNA-binding protein